MLTSLTVCVREQHQLVHRLDTPLAVDKLRSHPVQQFGMRRSLAVEPEIAWGADKALAEMMLPDPVYHSSRRQRIVSIRDPLRQRPPPSGTAAGKRNLCGLAITREFRKTRIRILAFVRQ